jgi:hypothetical protein
MLHLSILHEIIRSPTMGHRMFRNNTTQPASSCQQQSIGCPRTIIWEALHRTSHLNHVWHVDSQNCIQLCFGLHVLLLKLNGCALDTSSPSCRSRHQKLLAAHGHRPTPMRSEMRSRVGAAHGQRCTKTNMHAHAMPTQPPACRGCQVGSCQTAPTPAPAAGPQHPAAPARITCISAKSACRTHHVMQRHVVFSAQWLISSTPGLQPLGCVASA